MFDLLHDFDNTKQLYCAKMNAHSIRVNTNEKILLVLHNAYISISGQVRHEGYLYIDETI